MERNVTGNMELEPWEVETEWNGMEQEHGRRAGGACGRAAVWTDIRVRRACAACDRVVRVPASELAGEGGNGRGGVRRVNAETHCGPLCNDE